MMGCNIDPPKKQFHFGFIPMNIVQKLIKGIDIYDSSGVENISSKVLKGAFSVLYVELTSILNVSLNTGIFPDAWKIGNITPIPKEGKVLEANNRTCMFK